jgi:hypothetical protein
MFKPVRVVATIVFLAMIIMIFISAFVLHSSTLSISKHTSVVASVQLLKRGCSIRRARVPRLPLVYVVVHSLRAQCRAQSVRSFLNALITYPIITLYNPSSDCLGLSVMLLRVICFVLDTCTGFIFRVVRSTIYHALRVRSCQVASKHQPFNISATFTHKQGGTKDLQQMPTRNRDKASGCDHPLKSFFSVLNLSIISSGDVSSPDSVAALKMTI